MPRLFVSAERLAGPTVILEGDDHHYLTKVLRLAEGDRLAIFNGRGTEIAAHILRVTTRVVEVALGERTAAPLPVLSLTLLQAIPRGDRMDWIVQKVTELGASRIVPVVAARSVVRPGPGGTGGGAGAGGTRAARWRTIAEEAARQSGRADVPTVAEVVALPQALAGLAPVAERRFILWEGVRGQPLRQALPGSETVAAGHTGAGAEPARSIALLIGPEGGFEPAEVAAAEAAGFVPVGLGPRILRVETAAVAAVTLVQAAAGGLD